MLDHDELVRLYGPWRGRTPADAADLFRGYPGRWWIAGGWAIEAFSGIPRAHGDLDPSIPRTEVPLLRQHLAGRLDVWAADEGALRPLIGPSDEPLSATCENLWLRVDGGAPWEYDVILTDLSTTTWTYKRDSRITISDDELRWEHQGISYLRPEIQLLYKASRLRPQDQADFAACRALLDPNARRWLRSALDLAHSGHPWISQL